MSTTPSSAAKQAQEALGLRLRELRKDAGLSGRDIAAATGWHFTRVSKMETGVQGLSDLDIRMWCAACGADDEVPDLIAQARTVESMYLELRRQTRAGLRQLIHSLSARHERTGPVPGL
ncbi:helix-turn-helix domain-containing protein [Kribbella qitaiheensis]|uniref:helix-turn-helix domain-containing protein n=1 Tax=Kribbella qitaiheensis TaxID=1544730 RepID=UPI001FE984CA|nr:helix-turn-helix transcriptional regulator [Kribbella qitaiheensis]